MVSLRSSFPYFSSYSTSFLILHSFSLAAFLFRSFSPWLSPLFCKALQERERILHSSKKCSFALNGDFTALYTSEFSFSASIIFLSDIKDSDTHWWIRLLAFLSLSDFSDFLAFLCETVKYFEVNSSSNSHWCQTEVWFKAVLYSFSWLKNIKYQYIPALSW